MVSRVEVIAQSWWSWWYRLFNIRNYAIERFLVAYHSATAKEKNMQETKVREGSQKNDGWKAHLQTLSQSLSQLVSGIFRFGSSKKEIDRKNKLARLSKRDFKKKSQVAKKL